MYDTDTLDEYIVYITEVTVVFIIFCIALFSWRSMTKPEGFADVNSYNSVKTKVQTRLANYCKLTEFAQAQLRTMHSSATSGSDSDAGSFIQQIYRDVYTCSDELASSRAPCQVVSGEFIPCSTYTKLPTWSGSDSTKDSVASALSQIPDNLAARIMAESAYYKAVIKKLRAGIDAAKNPPSAPPDSPSSPSASPSGKPWGVEGFDGEYCSLADLQFRRAQSCKIPSLDAEIARVNAILDSGNMAAALLSSNGILAQMIQLQADIEAVKRQWDNPGSSKSYKQFSGGDRIKSFLFSLQQNG